MSKLSTEFALALALDGKLAKVDDETATLLAVVDALRALPEPEIDENWALALEQRLLEEGLDEAPVPVGRPNLTVVSFPETPVEDVIRTTDNVIGMPSRRFRVRKGVAAMAACFMLGAFPVMAAAHALPGSPLYGIKQGIFSAKIAMFGGAAQDAEWRMGHAREHIREAEALAGLGADTGLIDRTLGLAGYELAKAKQTLYEVGDPATLRQIARDAADIESLLEKSAPLLVPEAADAFGRVASAASSLTDSLIASIGQLEGSSIEAIVESLGEEVEKVVATAQTPPSTVEGSASGSGKVTTGKGPADDKDPGKDPIDDGDGDIDDGDGNENDGGTGKAIRGAQDLSCELPASYEVELLTGSSAELCTDAMIS